MPTSRIITGDCARVLREFPSDSFDLLVTDPPYGYSFMGKAWDKAVPSVAIWRECLRVLKPGAFAFVMSAPRQDVLAEMIGRLAAAGFATHFSSLYWTYLTGFPKAVNVGKAARRRNGRRSRGDLDGSYAGFQPKPAVEVILVAMKPLAERTYVAQALANRKGVTWLDDAKIPYPSGCPESGWSKTGADGSRGYQGTPTFRTRRMSGTEICARVAAGRFPANLLAEDGALGPTSRYFDLDRWAAERLPEEARRTFPFLVVPKAGTAEKNRGLASFSDTLLARSGGAQRAVAQGRSAYLQAHLGLNRVVRVKNGHPTVKPMRLMAYLITLGSRPGDSVLDPFVGSGTTCMAAKALGRNSVGIERERDYARIAVARVAAVPEPAA